MLVLATPRATTHWRETDTARGIDHSLPRYCIPSPKLERQQFAYLPCIFWATGKCRNLPITSHLSSWNRQHDLKNPPRKSAAAPCCPRRVGEKQRPYRPHHIRCPRCTGTSFEHSCHGLLSINTRSTRSSIALLLIHQTLY